MPFFGRFRRILRGAASTNVARVSEDLTRLARAYEPPAVDLSVLFRPSSFRVSSGELFYGLLPAREFDRFARLGDVAQSFERSLPDVVTGNPAVRNVLESFATDARRTLPDLPVASNDARLAGLRRRVRATDPVDTVDGLESIVARDNELARAIDRRVREIARTRRVKFVGYTLAISVGVAVTVGLLFEIAAAVARRSNGCFLYRGGTYASLNKCKLRAFSCNTRDAPLPEGVEWCSQTVDLPPQLFDVNACMGNDGSECIHCDMDETDESSLNWAYVDLLPEDALVRCEHRDALDALGEILGDLIDEAGDIVTNPIGAIGKCLSQAFCWIVIVGIVALIGAVIIFRVLPNAAGRLFRGNANNGANVINI